MATVSAPTNGLALPPHLVLASGNAGKLAELRGLLGPLGCRISALSDYSGESPAETGEAFVENALIKARSACVATGLPAIADDSGIVVAALGGAPDRARERRTRRKSP